VLQEHTVGGNIANNNTSAPWYIYVLCTCYVGTVLVCDHTQVGMCSNVLVSESELVELTPNVSNYSKHVLRIDHLMNR
jgi:hypothetical protein